MYICKNITVRRYLISVFLSNVVLRERAYNVSMQIKLSKIVWYRLVATVSEAFIFCFHSQVYGSN